MKSIIALREAIAALNKASVTYCVLRNFEFLLGDKSEEISSLDTVFARDDLGAVEKALAPLGFSRKGTKSFSHKHWGMSAYVSEDKRSVGFDGQIQDLHWNDIPYMKGELLFSRRKKVDLGNGLSVFTPSDEDSFIMFVTHSILGKRQFKEKYKKILLQLSQDEVLDWKYIGNHLSQIFGKGRARFLIESVRAGKFELIEKNTKRFISAFLLHKPTRLLPFFVTLFRWMLWKRKKTPIIAIIGPDGAGKSTASDNLITFLRKNDRKVYQIYLGRGKSQVLPIKKVGKKVQRNVDNKSQFLRKLTYTLAAPVFTLDLLLRYIFVVRPKRRNRTIVVTDRYATDILLMNNVPFILRKILFSFFPKPTLSFYLYNNPAALYKRRKQQSEEELARQMKIFDYIAKKVGAVRVETSSEEQTADVITEKTLMFLREKGF